MIKNKGHKPLNTGIFIIYFVAAFLCARNILSKPICRRPLKSAPVIAYSCLVLHYSSAKGYRMGYP